MSGRGPGGAARAMSRRAAIRVLAAAPLAAAFRWTPEAVARAAAQTRAARATAPRYEPRCFTAHEWDTVRLLVDLVIPRDARSGSATDAGVPEFMDFMCGDDADLRVRLRGGLAWLDHQCVDRHGVAFVTARASERADLLDDIAWPARARPEHAAGAAFFTSFRDLTASGFFSSRIGIEDLRYRGNTAVDDWQGCPPEVLARLGVSYDVMTRQSR